MANAEKALAVMLNDVHVASQEYCDVLNAETLDMEKEKAMKKLIADKTALYNTSVARAYYRTLAAEHGADAVKVALTADEIAVPGTIKIKIKRDKATQFATYEDADFLFRVDLIDMLDTIGGEYFHNPAWYTRLEAVANLVANAINKELGKNPKFQYAISDAAKQFNLSDAANPASIKSMTKVFQALVDDILWIGSSVNKAGEPVNGLKFEDYDWGYINRCMTTEGKSTDDVDVKSPVGLTQLVAKCIHNIMVKRDAQGNRLPYTLKVR